MYQNEQGRCRSRVQMCGEYVWTIVFYKGIRRNTTKTSKPVLTPKCCPNSWGLVCRTPTNKREVKSAWSTAGANTTDRELSRFLSKKESKTGRTWPSQLGNSSRSLHQQILIRAPPPTGPSLLNAASRTTVKTSPTSCQLAGNAAAYASLLLLHFIA